MTDIKTLKDIEEELINKLKENNDYYEIQRICRINKRLRQEAIKHWKHIKDRMTDEEFKVLVKIKYPYNTLDWLEHFFDITKEDLK